MPVLTFGIVAVPMTVIDRATGAATGALVTTTEAVGAVTTVTEIEPSFFPEPQPATAKPPTASNTSARIAFTLSVYMLLPLGRQGELQLGKDEPIRASCSSCDGDLGRSII